MKNLNCSIWFVCLFLAMSLSVEAQVKCSNKLLAEIVGQLPNIQINDKVSSEYIIPSISKDKPVLIHRNSEGIINHVGIKFFDRKVIEKHPSPIYFFIERYFLELLLLPNQNEITRKLEMERVKITSEVISMPSTRKGIQEIVSGVPHEFSLFITCNNNRYSASCMDGNKLFAKIDFPVRYELITGMTKLEAENSVYPALLLHAKKEYKPLTAAYMSDYKEGIYKANDDYYVTEDIISTSYYTKNAEKYVPVFSSDYMKESVYNLFNTGFDWGVQVEVEQNLYGNKKNTFTTSLANLACFLNTNGCSIYTGIRKFDKKTIEGVMMGVNTTLGYQHILMFTFDKSIINNPKGYVLKMKMYSYVPIHNVSSLF